MTQEIYDLVIIGGGINGAGIAADAAGRGLTVLLCEQHDLASGTSSKSSKLIHGGLRYLEYFDFRLVREALKEREVLLKKAPHLVWPMRFILPHTKALRPAFMIQLGLFLYDHLGHRSLLEASKRIDLSTDFHGSPLKSIFHAGFEYADCGVDDARLVIANALQARELGAKILNYTGFVGATRKQESWEVFLRPTHQSAYSVRARCLINAAGPWVNDILALDLDIDIPQRAHLVKGSHIVIRKFYEGEQAYILQHDDKRVIFVIPFHQSYCLIGTTDVKLSGQSIDQIEASQEEINYLCDIFNHYFNHSISVKDVLWHYAGVRALYAPDTQNPTKMSRDYAIAMDKQDKKPPFLSVFGGKITTYRKLAEHVLKLLKPYFSHQTQPWTADCPLPGGDIKETDFTRFYQRLLSEYSFLPTDLLYRFARCYGTNCYLFLKEVNSIDDLGQPLGYGLYAQEVQYLVEYEWAKSADDILWRRTKLGLVFTEPSKRQLQVFLNSL